MSKQGRIADLYAAYDYTCKRLKEEEADEVPTFPDNEIVREELIERKINIEAMLEAAIKDQYNNFWDKFPEEENEDTCGC